MRVFFYWIRYFAFATLALVLSCNGMSDEPDVTNDDLESVDEIASIEREKIYGERIDGPANVRDSINGKILFTINDQVWVDAASEENGWILIGIHIKLNQKQKEDFRILPNAILYDASGEIIGKSIDTLELWMISDDLGFVGAYTHGNNIKKHSVPEWVLKQEIQQGNLTKLALERYLWDFDFQRHDLNDAFGYEQYLIYESFVVDPSPRDRVTLLFNDAGTLAGVIHSRPLQIGKYKTYDLSRGHSLTVIDQLSPKEIQRIISERVHFYNSVD